VNLMVALDRTTTIRASVHDVQFTLGLSVLLVILVVFVFFRTVRNRHHPERRWCPCRSSVPSAPCIPRLQRQQPVAHALTIATGFVVMTLCRQSKTLCGI